MAGYPLWRSRSPQDHLDDTNQHKPASLRAPPALRETGRSRRMSHSHGSIGSRLASRRTTCYQLFLLVSDHSFAPRVRVGSLARGCIDSRLGASSRGGGPKMMPPTVLGFHPSMPGIAGTEVMIGRAIVAYAAKAVNSGETVLLNPSRRSVISCRWASFASLMLATHSPTLISEGRFARSSSVSYSDVPSPLS